MLDLLKNIHNKSEQMSGRKILITFIAIFVVFLTLGLLIGNLNNTKLKENEAQQQYNDALNQEKQISYEGKIEFLNPAFYPDDKITFALVDSTGKQLVLLKAKDQKLNIAEGLFVKVRGTASKTKDGKTDVLNVMEVVIKNATN